MNGELKPAVLNESNEGYGAKRLPHGWEELKELNQKCYEIPFRSGSFAMIIRELEPSLTKTVTTKPEKMCEVDLVNSYMVGKSHLALGNTEAAIRWFKVVWSQAGFRKYMLPEYHQYLAMATAELEAIAGSIGSEKVNAVSLPEVRHAGAATKSGCFIATAVYGSPLAEEVSTLCEYRDRVLSQTSLGKSFIRFYYWASPPFAKHVGSHDGLREIVRVCLIVPLLRMASERLAKE